MKVNPKYYWVLSILCWFGTCMAGLLFGYFLRFASRYSEASEVFTTSIRAAAVLLAIWLAVSIGVTVRTVRVTRRFSAGGEDSAPDGGHGAPDSGVKSEKQADAERAKRSRQNRTASNVSAKKKKRRKGGKR